MKYSIAAHRSTPEPLIEDRMADRLLNGLTRAMNRFGRNEVLHITLAAVVVILAIAAIV